jgi:hypothetical protein
MGAATAAARNTGPPRVTLNFRATTHPVPAAHAASETGPAIPVTPCRRAE